MYTKKGITKYIEIAYFWHLSLELHYDIYDDGTRQGKHENLYLVSICI